MQRFDVALQDAGTLSDLVARKGPMPERQLAALAVLRLARGRIHVIDRQALEHRSCECYGVISKGFPFFINQMDVPPLAPAD